MTWPIKMKSGRLISAYELNPAKTLRGKTKSNCGSSKRM